MRIVEVTWHAVEAFRERFPIEAGTPSYIRLLIAKEVEDAVNHHRYATKLPSWARANGRNHRGKRRAGGLDRTLRYMWTEDQRRVYLVDRHGDALRVVTSIRPEADTVGT